MADTRPPPLSEDFVIKLNAAELGALTALASRWMVEVGDFTSDAKVFAAKLNKKLFDAFPAPTVRELVDFKATVERPPNG